MANKVEKDDYGNTIETDENGKIVYEKHPDGFEEFRTYYPSGKLRTVETHYTNGIVEHERFADG